MEARIHSRHASAYDHWIHGAHLRLMAWLQEDAAGRTWDEIADGYDRELRTDEFLMGLNLFRRWLVRQAKVQSSPPDMMNLTFHSCSIHGGLSGKCPSLMLTNVQASQIRHAA